MSGGSYNYLCFKDADELWTCREDMARMWHRLVELGAVDVAAEVDHLALSVERFRSEATAQMERIQGVLKAVEWLDSNDWSERRLEEAVAAYRADLAADANPSDFPVRLPFPLGADGRQVDLLLFESGEMAWDATGYVAQQKAGS